MVQGWWDLDCFTWHTATGRHLTLDLHEELFGTWDLAGHNTRHQVDSQASTGKQLVVAYQITAGQDSLKRPATLLELDQPINVATIGDRFAFHREPTQDEQDPTTANLVLPGN